MAAIYDPKAIPDPTCAACKNDWPVNIDQETGQRFHVDILNNLIVDCPTDSWYKQDRDDHPDLEAGDD